MLPFLIRISAALAACVCIVLDAPAQKLSGTCTGDAIQPGRHIVLYETRGQDRFPVDSARIAKNGQFTFKQAFRRTGYYRLGTSDDQVDLILCDREPSVEILLEGNPLQEHITVVASEENKRLWEYKLASRDAQESTQRIARTRQTLDPRDIEALQRLSQEEDGVNERLNATLQRLVMQDQQSYFAKVVVADRRLMNALAVGPQAVRDSMDWTDASLVRSMIYAKAIMAILQAATPANAATLAAASDSVLFWAEGDTACWSFAREQLIEIFSTYGPSEVVQHLVDRYIAGPGSLTAADSELRTLVAAQLKSAIGALAPDVELPSPISGQTDRLLELVQPYPCTVLFFYSSTCDHCHAEMPPLNSLHERFARKGLSIIGIAIDDDEALFRSNIAERGLKFPCYSELRAWGSPAAKAFAVQATPWLIVLDREGRIVAKPANSRELEELLPRLLP